MAKLRRMRTWALLVGVATALLALLQRHRNLGHRNAREWPAFKQRVRTLHYRLARAGSELLPSLSPTRYRALACGP